MPQPSASTTRKPDPSSLASDASPRLRSFTDGWVAALQLASLSLRGRDDPTELIAHLSGRHRPIGDYLVENVLNTFEPDILDFVLRTSITERLSVLSRASTSTRRSRCAVRG
jgi:ATP/maltotriose-dependent transcriptional regulator MalT